jgi:hypothetical protein
MLTLTILIPFAAALKVVLLVEVTANNVSAWEVLANVLPFHAVTKEFDDLRNLIQRPF